ncbi:polysaccharide lyase beta-sandwich domain-containing protein [uncultured Bacteroides sp.]|uniref:polysaccharide lyase beta-sandwich domain-containing protein n=1 Tax=uncultured Bacteroides sp. TaxID=162156 RepID=UPI0025995919|nr:polysaccharide lyase beta-sandwich domain-containing protein [uncultured Bacteroides sp.]
MKLKTFSLLLLVVLLGTTGFNAVAQDTDFEIIYQRMYERYLDKSPSQTAVEKLLQIMTPEGAFKGIDYHATDGSPRKHVQSLITLARAYQHPESPYYHQPKVRDSYLKSLNFWVDTNHQAKNWWYRYIPYPKELSTGIILMSREIEQDKALFDKCIAYLRWSYETARPGLMTGANGADIIMGSFAASILTRNDAQMRDFQQRMTRLLTIQPVEGVQPDYLFAQHCGSGRQLYFTNYGKEFVNSMLKILANSETVQAVFHQTLGITEALFYQPGELKLDNGDLIRTDTPCALLWNEGKQKLSVANPHCESTNPASIRITLVRNGRPVEVSFDMPQQESAGRSVAKFVSLPQN